MDATISPVPAQQPFAPFVAILRPDLPRQVGRKRRKGVNPRSRPCVAPIDAARLKHEAAKAGARTEVFPPREREDLAAVAQSPPLRPLALQPPRRLWTPPAVWSAPNSPLRLLWPSSDRIVRSRLATKSTKGSNPRSRPCVASIDAAGLNHEAAKAGARTEVLPPREREDLAAVARSPPLRPLALKPPRRLWTPPAVWSAPNGPLRLLWPSSGRKEYG